MGKTINKMKSTKSYRGKKKKKPEKIKKKGKKKKKSVLLMNLLGKRKAGENC